MIRRWILLVAPLCLFPATAFATKPTPPPPPPKIVGIMPGSPLARAVASDGTVYDIAVSASDCDGAITTARVVGHLFANPPVSPIASAFESGIGLVATLENGDLWVFHESCCTACYLTGTFYGNIFTVAGAAALPQMNLAPIPPTPESAKARTPALHAPQIRPVPGSVE